MKKFSEFTTNLKKAQTPSTNVSPVSNSQGNTSQLSDFKSKM